MSLGAMHVCSYMRTCLPTYILTCCTSITKRIMGTHPTLSFSLSLSHTHPLSLSTPPLPPLSPTLQIKVMYMRPANIIKNHMSQYVPLAERTALQCAGMEASRLLCHMASVAAGYHIEEMVHVLDLWGLTPVGMLCVGVCLLLGWGCVVHTWKHVWMCSHGCVYARGRV